MPQNDGDDTISLCNEDYSELMETTEMEQVTATVQQKAYQQERRSPTPTASPSESHEYASPSSTSEGERKKKRTNTNKRTTATRPSCIIAENKTAVVTKSHRKRSHSIHPSAPEDPRLADVKPARNIKHVSVLEQKSNRPVQPVSPKPRQAMKRSRSLSTSSSSSQSSSSSTSSSSSSSSGQSSTRSESSPERLQLLQKKRLDKLRIVKIVTPPRCCNSKCPEKVKEGGVGRPVVVADPEPTAWSPLERKHRRVKEQTDSSTRHTERKIQRRVERDPRVNRSDRRSCPPTQIATDDHLDGDAERGAKRRRTVQFIDTEPRPRTDNPSSKVYLNPKGYQVLGHVWDGASDTTPRDYDVSPPLKRNELSWRETLVSLVSNTHTNRILFLHTLVEDDICYGFAVASSNNVCEGFGVQYDVRRQRHITDRNTRFSMSMENVLRRRNWLRSCVNPQDIVRFAVLNTESPILLGCDLDRLISTDQHSSTFLGLCCRLDDVDRTSLSFTDGKHVCFDCYPSMDRPAVFVTRSNSAPQLFCQYHARARVNEMDLMFYRPTLVSMSANEKQMWISTFLRGEPRGLDPDRWSPLVCCALNRRPLLPRKPFRDAELLLNIAKDNGMEWRSGDHVDPVNVVRTLQNLCTEFSRQRLCSPAAELIPASRAARHSDTGSRSRAEHSTRGYRSRTVDPCRRSRSRTVDPSRRSRSRTVEPCRRRRSPSRARSVFGRR